MKKEIKNVLLKAAGAAILACLLPLCFSSCRRAGTADSVSDPDYGISRDLTLAAAFAAGSLGTLAVVAASAALAFRFRGRNAPRPEAPPSVSAVPAAASESLRLALAEAEGARAAGIEASRLNSLFIACAGHELRTPLHGVLSVARLLEKPLPDQERSRLVGVLEASALQLNRLLDDLLKSAGSQASKLTLKPAEFLLGDFADWMETLLRPEAEAKGLRFAFDCEGSGRLFTADRDRIAQIVVNLATNAVKYTDAGEICVRLYATDRDLEILVRDTGAGIPEEEQAYIFEPFFRGSREGGSSPAGLGLGLSIVKGLAEAMGGIVRVESIVGKGTSLSVLLPLPSKFPGPLAAPAAPGGTKSLLVLLAEDNAINRLYLERCFADAGYRALTARDGREALALYEQHFGAWGLLLMDVTMPNLNGLDAAREIRAFEARKGEVRVPIIALTAHSTDADRKACADAGMDAFLGKPFAEKRLWTEVTRFYGLCAALERGDPVR